MAVRGPFETNHEHHMKLRAKSKMCRFCGVMKREEYFCTVKTCTFSETKRVRCRCR